MATTTMAMQPRQLRSVLWLVTAGLGALAGWQLWTLYQRFRAGDYVPAEATDYTRLISEARGTLDQAEVSQATWDDYVKLRTTPINGHVPEPPKPPDKPVEAPKDPPKKPLSDVLRVTGIAAGPGDLGRVAVKYKDDTVKPFRDELILGVGAPLTAPYDDAPYHGKVRSIEADGAVFEWFGEDVVLRPPRREDLAKDGAKAVEPAQPFDASLSDAERELLASHKNSERTIALPNDAGYVLGSKDQRDLSNNAEAYLRDARLSEQKNADGKRELTVGALRSSSPLARNYGVQAGDTLISINGQPISTKAEAYSYVRENPGLSKYVVVLRRKGREVTKTVLVNRD